MLTAALHEPQDLQATFREVLDHGPRHTDHVSDAALHPLEANIEPLAHLGTQRRLIDVAGGLRVPVQQPPVKRRPAPIRPEGHVRDDDVRVQ